MELYKKAKKRMAKETGELGSVVRAGVTVVGEVEVEEEELTAAVKDVMEVTGMVSVAVFEGIGMSLGWRRRNRNWMRKGTKVKLENGIMEFMEMGVKKSEEDEVRMKDLEEWIRSIQDGTQNFFRTLMNTRVSILNALSH